MSTKAIVPVIVCTVLLIGLAGCRGPAREEGGSATTAQPRRSDAEIVTAVRARFYTDDTMRGHDVNVSAKDGVVTLRGDVRSISVQTRAVELARAVEGVARVDDQMTPGVPTAVQKQPESATPSEDAASVRTRVLAAYFRAPTIKSSQIEVASGSNGMVTLNGEVEGHAARDLAEQVARGVEGVTAVDNRLRVRNSGAGAPAGTAARPSDDEVRTRVQSQFFTHPATKAQPIDVRVAQGVVSLSGTVADTRSRREAIELARNTSGVQRVEANLSVPANASAGTSGTSGLSASLARSVGHVEDSWITTQVEARFFASPEIKARPIDVQTKAGVVTLSGQVGSPEAKEEAAAIAKEIDGVTRVVNQLTVES
jgi:hyperosmotically inducible periplasmic protein